MQITNKVYQKALELNLNAKALKGLDILDVFTILYQQHNIYPQITIKTREYVENEVTYRKLDFEWTLIKVSIREDGTLNLETLKAGRAETCSLIEAHEIAFCKAVDYINGNIK